MCAGRAGLGCARDRGAADRRGSMLALGHIWAVCWRAARAAGFESERWTLKRIAAVITREFGVRYHPRYLERPLKAHGFSVQRPASRAKERDELVIAVWPKREWVALKKRRGASGARFCSGTRPAIASGRGRARPGRGVA